MQYVLFLLVLIMLLLNFTCCFIYFWILCVVFEWLKLQLLIITYKNMGHAVAHWWRQSTTSQKVTGSIPDGVTGIFHWHSPSGFTMALGFTQPLKEMSTRNISWAVKAAGAQGWQPYHLHVPIVSNSGSLNLLEPSGPVETGHGIALHKRI